MASSIPLRKRFPRLSTFVLLSAALLLTIALLSPVQLPVVLYKLSLITLAAVLAYWLDRALFPYARPDGYLIADWRKGCASCASLVDFPIVPDYHIPFVAACLRRAIIVLAVVVGVALGL